MIVSRSSFQKILANLEGRPALALDTETFGLRPWHGDRLFSIVLSDGAEAFYFNFQAAPDIPAEFVLSNEHMEGFHRFCSESPRIWAMHNAKYDMAILAQEGIELQGTIHCTMAQARVERNDYLTYDLDSCLERIGLKKDDRVDAYILEHKLYENRVVPGRVNRAKDKHFNKVPFDLIVPYAEQDALGTFQLYNHQILSIGLQSAKLPPGCPAVKDVMHRERSLTRVVFEMERTGVLVDLPYCARAAAYEADRLEKAKGKFRRETGGQFNDHYSALAKVFQSEKDRWEWNEPTKTGQVNPSFNSELLRKWENPAAQAVVKAREAKSKLDFYTGFIYHADRNGVIHPTFNQHGAETGRFSSSEPNLQNLSAEEGIELEQEFVVRRAIIPRPGFLFIMPDFDQMEYRLMLEYACKFSQARAADAGMAWKKPEIIDQILGGLDIHEATAQMMGVTRSRAKTLNFMLLYGGGAGKLARALDIPVGEAMALKSRYFRALPDVLVLMEDLDKSIRTRGYLRNWAGRRCYFKDLRFAYKGPNSLIQGGCADVMKELMVQLSDVFAGTRSRMVLTIHDEPPCEIHESEAHWLPKRVKEVMESIYPAAFLPLTVGMEYSRKSLGDKVKGFPV